MSIGKILEGISVEICIGISVCYGYVIGNGHEYG